MLPATVHGTICHHLNAHLIRTSQEVFVHPFADVALGSPGHQSFREPLAADAREIFFLEALAQPAVAVVRQLQVTTQVGTSQPQSLLALGRHGYWLLDD